jgi:aldehyde dehydrogenase (NAD+)
MTVALKAPLRAIPSTDVAKIPSLVRRLRTTFDSGQTRPLHWRRDQLRRLRDLVRDHGDELAQALYLDLGKPEFEAWSLDLAQVTAEATLALGKLVAWSRPQRAPGRRGLGRCKIVREPLGVALIIAPWNDPVGLLLSPLVGAIAAGNCAVLKPSESAIHTSAVLAKRIREVLDPTAIAVVEGGVGESGMGAYHGRHTFETFSHRKVVMTRGLRFDPKLRYPPYTERKTRWIRRIL